MTVQSEITQKKHHKKKGWVMLKPLKAAFVQEILYLSVIVGHYFLFARKSKLTSQMLLNTFTRI